MELNNDSMLLDVEKAPQAADDVLDDRSDKNRPTMVSMVSASDLPSATLNGYDGSRPNSTPSIADDPPASLLKRAEQSSRDPSGLASAVEEQFSLNSSGRSGFTTDDEETSDDPDFEHQSRARRLQLAALPTGLCYDVRMRYHCELDPPKQRLDFHPEDPRRIYSIYKEFCLAGLVDDPQSTRPIVSMPLQRVGARNATRSEICLVHDSKHFDFIESTKGIVQIICSFVEELLTVALDMTEDMLIHLERQYDSIYFNRLTYASALLSTGGAIDICRLVVGRKLKNAIAVIRPPGHHAECNRPMGFCIFDNVSIAAKVCQREYDASCRKVLILDWYVILFGLPYRL